MTKSVVLSHGASGGGHPAAAGDSFEKNDFQKFLWILADYVKEF